MANTMNMHAAGGPFAPLASLMVEAVASAMEGLQGLTVNPIAKLAQLQARAQQRRHLMELEDRLLADIGLDRVDAIKEARKPVWKA